MSDELAAARRAAAARWAATHDESHSQAATTSSSVQQDTLESDEELARRLQAEEDVAATQGTDAATLAADEALARRLQAESIERDGQVDHVGTSADAADLAADEAMARRLQEESGVHEEQLNQAGPSTSTATQDEPRRSPILEASPNVGEVDDPPVEVRLDRGAALASLGVVAGALLGAFAGSALTGGVLGGDRTTQAQAESDEARDAALARRLQYQERLAAESEALQNSMRGADPLNTLFSMPHIRDFIEAMQRDADMGGSMGANNGMFQFAFGGSATENEEQRGLSGAQIAELPVSEATQADTEATCAICLSEYKQGDRIRTLPCCHRYHVDCIDQWLGTSSACPVCKHNLV